jgi:hypothetical protein
MAVALEKRGLPRANVRDAADPFPSDQYVKVSNVAIFSEHSTKTPDGDPQNFDQDALERLIDRGNERIAKTGDYAAVCVGHTHDPDDPNGAEEQPEVIGAMGPYRLGLLGHPGRQQKYAILADLWIRKDRIDKYNAHPRRSVELWYEHDKPAWIDPLSLLTEAPRLDLGLTPLIPTAGDDGAELKYLYAASFGGLRRVKYAAEFASMGNTFVPADTGNKPKHYAAEPKPQEQRKELMLAPEDIRQICDAIETLDVMVAMRDFMPMIPRVQELLETEGAEHAAENEVPTGDMGLEGAEAGSPEAGLPGEVPPPEGMPGEEPEAELPPPAADEAAPPADEPLPEDLEKVKHAKGQDVGETGKCKDEKNKDVKLDDMSEEDIERYLCSRRKTKYAAEAGGPDGKASDAPAESTVDPGKVAPTEGSVSGTTQKYSMLEAKLAELEADKIERTNEARKAKLQQIRYHRAFDLDKEITRCNYAKMSDAAFKDHVEFIAEVATPTLANHPMPVPDELLDSTQPPASIRQRPERYSKEACEEAGRICYEMRTAGQKVTYEAVLESVISGKPLTA